MIEWHSCGSFRVIDEPKTLALFAQQQKHHPHHIITISSFTVHDYVVHASFIRGTLHCQAFLQLFRSSSKSVSSNKKIGKEGVREKIFNYCKWEGLRVEV
ncbi:hypothetical protein T06_4734 [Trichinella sp. T6]|nr:hypothetical protein T06_4734 [Trichinella sp. T6]